MAIAQATKLGYVIYQDPEKRDTTKKSVRISTATAGPATDIALLQQLQQFWTIEDLPNVTKLKPEEQECERLFQESCSRQPDGRYEVKMPFNPKITLLGKSKSVALKQLFAMEHKMKIRPQFSTDYHNYMTDFEKQGFMQRISETTEHGYYTPHHGVYGASKEKIRIVYNASCKTSTGISLNECQYTGAKLQDDLAIILMRFRTHRIGLTADIKAMYCQVSMHKEHQPYQKILWRHTTKEPVGVYQITRVAFGQTAAPFLAIRAMHQCARDHAKQYPDGAQAILSSFYVDDLLTGANSATETTRVADQIKILSNVDSLN